MSRKEPPRPREHDGLGLTNGNGVPRPAGLTNGLGRTNGAGRTNGLTNGLTNGVRGRTNGLTNGLRGRTNGLTNGLVNGNGRTNGMGRTNGLTNGLTNGRGATNGTGVINGLINGSYKRGLRQNRYGVITHKDLRLGLSIIVLALLLLGPFYLILSTPLPPPPTRITVDGSLGDWGGIAFLNDTVPASNANVRLRAYSALLENGYLSFAIRVEGIALGDSSGLDAFYVYVDKDANPSTGYQVRELGADYLVAIRGGDNAVSSAALYGFVGAAARDWSGWQNLQSVPARASVNSVEVQLAPGDVDLEFSGTTPRHSFLVAASDYEGVEATGRVHFDERLRALLVTPDVANPVVTVSGDVYATLGFTALGGPITVTQASLTRNPGPAPGFLTSVSGLAVPDMATITRDVQVTFSGAEAGGLVSTHVDPAAVLSTAGSITNPPVTVDGPDLDAYLGSAPTEHRVDGYFGEWTCPTCVLGIDPGSVADRNVDIVTYAANRSATTETAFVYADVAGRIFGGSAAPERFDRPSGGTGGTPGTPPPRTAEDVFRTYIDVDTASPAGTWTHGVQADFLLEVRGLFGRVTSSSAFQWSPSTRTWTAVARAVWVSQDRSEMEASLDLTGVATGLMAMSVEATDWKGIADATGVFNFLDHPGGGTRGSDLPGILDGANADAVTVPVMSSAPAIDGNCGDSIYTEAIFTIEGFIRFYAGLNGDFLYVCVIVIDTTDNPGDYGTLLFDQNHDGGSAPQADDRNFTVKQDDTFERWKGDGSGWVDCSSDCSASDDAKAGFVGSPLYPNFEYKIHKADAWADIAAAAGFAIHAHNAAGSGADYYWGSDAVDPEDPGSWGHITAPEFSDAIVPACVVVVIYLVARRRRRDADP